MPSHEVARLLRDEGDRVSCHEAPSSPTDVSVRWSSSALSKEGEGDRRPAIGDACSIMPASAGRRSRRASLRSGRRRQKLRQKNCCEVAWCELCGKGVSGHG